MAGRLDMPAALTQRTVAVHRIGPYQAVGLGAALDHIERALVGREAQTVGAGDALDNPGHLQCAAIDAVDRVRQLGLNLVPLVIVASLEGRIAEPDGPIALDHHVVRRVEALALIVVGQHGDRTVVLGTGHAPTQFMRRGAFADHQPALAIAGQAIGEVRLFAKYAQRLADLVPTHDAVVGNVAEQQVAPVANPYRTFGPAQTVGDLLDAGVEQAQLQKAFIQYFQGWIGVTPAEWLS